MLKIALVYGAISGVIVISVMTAGIAMSGGEGGASSQAFGYLIMLIALSLIFVGVKRHRDRNLGGVIKFGGAFLTGVSIAAVAGLFYVAGWEAYLASTDYAFIDQYTAGVIEAKRESGADAAALAKVTADMETLTARYANPLFRIPITFSEIFPVGLIIALISALILRNPKAFPAR
ncbi:DUF4199 domain-containing protein [Hyphococcus sp.]|uniref:DUF4199 domain-containing protein n=1 Tax=Hyphococcus sp. TaxID=2038636 RepID=UPI003CCC3E58